MLNTDTRDMMADAKFFEAYSRWDDSKGRYETWDEAVDRVMDMHRSKYADKMTPELESLFDEASDAYKDKLVLGAQRALQFGGEQILKHNLRLYNCLSTHANRASYFGELFYSLLCGAGVGFSVQYHHVYQMSKLAPRKGQPKIFKPDDSIEGWAQCVDVLMSSFFADGGKYPEYQGKRVFFDLSEIRPKGAEISGGFKAPGPEPLRKALDLIEHLLNDIVLKGKGYMEPIDVYDISMYIADAVLAGGVRRAATIALFSPDDKEMINAKTGDWFITNPQRGRSNNSMVFVRGEVTLDGFLDAVKMNRQFGEPGFVFVDDREFTFNPCVEIGKLPVFFHEDDSQESGFQGCNLSEINGGACASEEIFIKACRAASILGTIQAGYTDFKYLTEVSKKIFERESLIGVSVTGWMQQPDVLLDESVMRKGAQTVMSVNKEVAAMLGINPAARGTCVKPSGNASVQLKTTSATSAEHSEFTLRNVQMNKEQEVARLIAEKCPYMVEESVWSSSGSDYVISFPIVAKEGVVLKRDVTAIDMLKNVKSIQQNWIEYGTDESLCVDKRLRHNVSNTINVGDDEWDDAANFIFENQDHFAGITMLSKAGDKDYNQAPMTSVLTENEIVEKYGAAALFASGLIVDCFKGFNDLWAACFTAQLPEDQQPGGEAGDKQADWIRRFRKFASNYFQEFWEPVTEDGSYVTTDEKETLKVAMKRAEYCLKDVYLLHRWNKIQKNLVEIDFVNDLQEKTFTEISTMAASACSAGQCEI